MGGAERRDQIMSILYRRRHETIDNLANEFGVSERTIRRDIERLSLSAPIYTKVGRFGGGIYILEGYIPERKYMTEQEMNVFKKVYHAVEKDEGYQLKEDEIEILKNMIQKYEKPTLERRKKK